MKKYRLTPTRSRLLQILQSTRSPVSADEIRRQLPVNKTTIYRQLESLTRQKLVSQVNFADRVIRYESARQDHHHHLICTNCRRVLDITFPENIEEYARPVAAARKFSIEFHNLEFFGLCAACQKC